MRAGLLSSRTRPLEVDGGERDAATASGTDSDPAIPRYSHAGTATPLSEEGAAVDAELGRGQSEDPIAEPEVPVAEEDTEETAIEPQTEEEESSLEDGEENAEGDPAAVAEALLNGEAEGEGQEEDETAEDGEGEEATLIGPAAAPIAADSEAKPFVPLAAALPDMAPIQTPFIPSPPLAAVERRDEIIKRTGSPPELHHAQVRQAAETVTQAARDARRRMLSRVNALGRDTRISIEDMAAEVWKATRSAIGQINTSIDTAMTRIQDSATAEMDHVKSTHIAQGDNVEQVRDGMVVQIYNDLKSGSTQIQQAETIAAGRFDQKLPTARGFMSAIPNAGKVGRLATSNAEGGFDTAASADSSGQMVNAAESAAEGTKDTVAKTRPGLTTFLEGRARSLSRGWSNINRYLLARGTPHLEGHSNQQQRQLESAATQGAERMANPANRAQFMTMVLGLTGPVSEHHDQDQTQSMDTETWRNDAELAALSRADAQAVFTLRQRRDNAKEYADRDLRGKLCDDLGKQGRKARDGLLEQSVQAAIGLDSAGAIMARDYADLISRLDALLEPGKFLNARQLVPQILMARETARRMQASHEAAAAGQAESTLESLETVKKDQIDALAKAVTGAMEGIGDVVIRSQFDMGMFASMVTGRMSDGARASIDGARTYAEKMTRGILSTNEAVNGPALRQIDNIAASFFNSHISGAEAAQVEALDNFVKRLEGRAEGGGNGEGGPLVRPMLDANQLIRQRAGTLDDITRGPDPAVVAGGAVLTYAVPVVGAIATGVYLYQSDPDDNQVVTLLGELPWPAVPAVGDMFQLRGFGNLYDRISEKISEPQRSTALGLFDESDVVRGFWRTHGIENSTGWFDLNRAAREALGEGMSESEHAAMQEFAPERLAAARDTIIRDLESHERDVALAFLDNNHERAIGARTRDALARGRRDSSWGWIFSAEEAQRRSDRARVDAMQNMDTMLRAHLERHHGYVDEESSLYTGARDQMFREIASLADPRRRSAEAFTAEQGRETLIAEATRAQVSSVIGFGFNPLMPMAGPGLQAEATRVETSAAADQYIRDLVNKGPSSDEARSSRGAFELTQAEGHRGLFGTEELPETAQTYLTDAFENPRLSGLERQLADLDRELETTTDPVARDRLLERRRGVQAQFNEEQGLHRERMRMMVRRLDPAAGDLTPEQAEQYMARRVGRVFARRDSIFTTPRDYSHATYGTEMITHGRASLEAGTALATEGPGTHESLLLRSYRGRSRAEYARARDWWRENYDEDMDVAMGIRDREWEASDYVMAGLSPLGWLAVRGAETSGDTAMELGRIVDNERETDLDNLRFAHQRHHDERVRGTGLIASVTMEGTQDQANLDGDREALARLIVEEAERRQPGSAAQYLSNPTAIFNADGTIDPAIEALTFRDGNFVGDRALFADAARSVSDSADAYQAEIARQESMITTTISLLALVATVAAMLIPGVNVIAAGVAVAIVSGIATVLVKAGMRGERYGWEEMATDVAMTAIEAGSAGLGGALGKVGAFARLGKVGGAFAREAISGALTAGAQIAIQDETWANGFGRGLETIASGALRQGVVQGVTAGVAEGVTMGMNRAFRGRLDPAAVARAEQQAGSAGRAYRNAMATEAVSEFIGTATGEAVGIWIDYERGEFRGSFGDALKHIGMSALRDMAVGGLRGAVNTRNRQRHQRLLETLRSQDGAPTPEQLRTLRLVGISAGEYSYSDDINHVRADVEDGRARLARLPEGLREQVRGLDAESLGLLLNAVGAGGFRKAGDRAALLSKIFEGIPGFDARRFAAAVDAAAESRARANKAAGPDAENSQRIRNHLGAALPPALRQALEGVPVQGLQHLDAVDLRRAAEMIARGELDTKVADALFRRARATDPELDETTFLGNLGRAADAARQALDLDRMAKQQAHAAVMEVIDSEDRTLLSGMPEEGILEFKRLLDARDGGTPDQRERLYRMALETHPDLPRNRFDQMLERGLARATELHRQRREQVRAERERLLQFLPQEQRRLIALLPEHLLIELRIQQQSGGELSPAMQRRFLDAALREQPDLDTAAMVEALQRAVALPAETPAADTMAKLRSELAAALPSDQRHSVDEVPILILRGAEFLALTRSASGEAVTLILHGRPVVVMREGADPMVLREEGIHILQSRDPDWASRVGMLDEARLADWDHLPLAEQVALYKNKVEVEIDAQRRLIESLQGDITRVGDTEERGRLQNRLALTTAALRNLERRYHEVSALSGLRLLTMASGALARPQWLDQPARLFGKTKDTTRTDTEPIRPVEDEAAVRRFLVDFMSEGLEPAQRATFERQLQGLATADLRTLFDRLKGVSPEHMRNVLWYVGRSQDQAGRAARLAEVAQVLRRLSPEVGSNLVRDLALTRLRAFNDTFDVLIRLGAIDGLGDAHLNRLAEMTFGTGADKDRVIAAHLKLIAELALPDTKAGTAARLDGAQLSMLLDTVAHIDSADVRKILKAISLSSDAAATLGRLRDIYHECGDHNRLDLLRFITDGRNSGDTLQVIEHLHKLRAQVSDNAIFQRFFEMLVLSDSHKIKMLATLVDLTARLDAGARRALAGLIERSHKREHPDILQAFSDIHDRALRQIEADLLPVNQSGRLLSLIIEMAGTRAHWKVFREQAVVFLKTLHDLHMAGHLRAVEVPDPANPDGPKIPINGVQTIVDYLTRVKTDTSLSPADRAERLTQLAADITAAAKAIHEKDNGSGAPPKLLSLADRSDVLANQVRNLVGEGVLAGRDAWRAHLANEASTTWPRMQASEDSRHFAALLKAVRPDWDTAEGIGQLGAMAPLQRWFEKLAQLHGLDPRSDDPAVQVQLHQMLKSLMGGVRDLNRRERFEEVSRSFREAVARRSLALDPNAAQRRDTLRSELLQRLGFAGKDLAAARPHDGGVLSQHIDTLVERMMFYREMDRLAGEIGASSAGIKQNVTEAIGEIELTIHMIKTHPDFVLAMPFGKGTGFDQVWIRTDTGALDGRIIEVVIGEAKGPRAELGNPDKGAQMGTRWVANTLREMAASSDPGTRALAKRLIEAAMTLKGGAPPFYRGIVVRAEEVPNTKPQEYEPKDVTTPGTGGAGYDFTGITLPDPNKIKVDS